MLSPWLAAMVSLCWLLGAGRCPGRWTAIDAGAGTLLDVKRAAQVHTVIDGGAWTPDSKSLWEPLETRPAPYLPVRHDSQGALAVAGGLAEGSSA